MLEREHVWRQQAEAANHAKDEFLAMLSHELCTPLTSILGWAAILKHNALNAEKTAQAINIIEANARQQNALIEDLRDAHKALIIVTDNGCGMKADLIPHIFERFKQADSSMSRSYNGLGLGLAIVRSLVELHGGRVWAVSADEQQGSTFTVELPLIEPVETVNPPPAGGGRETSQSAANLPLLIELRILVVDDYEAIRHMLQSGLAHHGAEVTCAGNGREALQIINDTPPDLLISDIGMPDMDGLELIKHVRRLSANGLPFIPAIALTGYAGAENRDRVLAAGYQLHLAKPYDVM
ncbi:MAG: ATP-binding protein [Methylobacter sp.]|nr:ATP-binding protein [Methylobacter sp.]